MFLENASHKMFLMKIYVVLQKKKIFDYQLNSHLIQKTNLLRPNLRDQLFREQADG